MNKELLFHGLITEKQAYEYEVVMNEVKKNIKKKKIYILEDEIKKERNKLKDMSAK